MAKTRGSCIEIAVLSQTDLEWRVLDSDIAPKTKQTRLDPLNGIGAPCANVQVPTCVKEKIP
jgi:hypothetical protein